MSNINQLVLEKFIGPPPLNPKNEEHYIKNKLPFYVGNNKKAVLQKTDHPYYNPNWWRTGGTKMTIG